MTESELAAVIAREEKAAAALVRERNERQSAYRTAVAYHDALRSAGPDKATATGIRRAEVAVEAALRNMAHWGDEEPVSQAATPETLPVTPPATRAAPSAAVPVSRTVAPRFAPPVALVSVPAATVTRAAAPVQESEIDAMVARIINSDRGPLAPSSAVKTGQPIGAHAPAKSQQSEIDAIAARIAAS